MLSLEDAIKKANEYLNAVVISPPMELALLLDDTIEFKYGWVFFYQSKEYLRTGNFLDALGGNAPIIINRHDGSLHVTGTAYPIEKYITDYEEALERR